MRVKQVHPAVAKVMAKAMTPPVLATAALVVVGLQVLAWITLGWVWALALNVLVVVAVFAAAVAWRKAGVAKKTNKRGDAGRGRKGKRPSLLGALLGRARRRREQGAGAASGDGVSAARSGAVAGYRGAHRPRGGLLGRMLNRARGGGRGAARPGGGGGLSAARSGGHAPGSGGSSGSGGGGRSGGRGSGRLGRLANMFKRRRGGSPSGGGGTGRGSGGHGAGGGGAALGGGAGGGKSSSGRRLRMPAFLRRRSPGRSSRTPGGGDSGGGGSSARPGGLRARLRRGKPHSAHTGTSGTAGAAAGHGAASSRRTKQPGMLRRAGRDFLGEFRRVTGNNKPHAKQPHAQPPAGRKPQQRPQPKPATPAPATQKTNTPEPRHAKPQPVPQPPKYHAPRHGAQHERNTNMGRIGNREDASLQGWGRSLKKVSPVIDEVAGQMAPIDDLLGGVAQALKNLTNVGRDDLPADARLVAEVEDVAAEAGRIRGEYEELLAKVRGLSTRAESLFPMYANNHDTDEGRLNGERGGVQREKRADVGYAQMDT